MGKFVLGLVCVLAAFALVALLAPPLADAATITPTITIDEDSQVGPEPNTGCSLREAISAANTDGVYGGCSVTDDGPDTINLADGATYGRSRLDGGPQEDGNLNGDLDIQDPAGGQVEQLTITAPGPSGANIEGTTLATGGRVIDIIDPSTTVTISRVEINKGRTTASGGAISNVATLNVSDTLMNQNTAEVNGGGLVNGGIVNFTNVTISGNFARRDGGGIWDTAGGLITLNNVTIIGNQADTDGSDMFVGVGGGILRSSGTVSLRNTLVALNLQIMQPFPGTAPDCSGTMTSQGYNVIGNTLGCGWTSTTGDITGVANPLAAALAENGGPTRTRALQPGSPAIDTGNPAVPGSGGFACAATDQRGVGRPLGPRCDIGAFEADFIPPSGAGGGGGPGATPGPTGLRAGALKKCKKKKSAAARRKCKRRANLLPV